MLKDFSRSMRLERSLHKEIAAIIQQKIRDPRLNSLITIVEVKLSTDLSYAKIFFTCLYDQDKRRIQLILGILQKATGFIRSLINKNIYLRIVPNLCFIHDISFSKGILISQLIEKSKFY
ncbi:30S ribosome-binding factor RbfA [Buchnera aphidicola]|uniref:Ribosome-binding factor A n=1 Tax=Buchnera aphidicola (Cinara cf. splendens/pseudotsugae 3390) TaxID=2518980 RepID=A0A451CWU3_9GAMM|nr:30S ribosome-binding factor RbfA [Buchnera aphidicola]VFP77818.1 30S ribosome-binding factor [Buchnera aphidicola (Cinara cf. splendens/pseudotsugae 3390)]